MPSAQRRGHARSASWGFRLGLTLQVWADIGYLGGEQHTACTVKLPHCVQQVECDVRANGKRLIHLFKARKEDATALRGGRKGRYRILRLVPAPDHREPRLSTFVTNPFIPNTSNVSSRGLPAQISHYYYSVPTRCVTATGSNEFCREVQDTRYSAAERCVQRTRTR